MASDDVHGAPLRSLDDFILDGARFQVPPFKDMDKWSNRIIANLLYYQTNYGLLILAIFLLIGFFNPRDMLVGFVAVTVAFVAFAYLTNQSVDAVRFKKEHPFVGIVVAAVAGWIFVGMFSSVIVLLFGIALPMLFMFLHASTRLRSLKNKLASKLEGAGFKRTAMGQILEALGIELDRLVFTL